MSSRTRWSHDEKFRLVKETLSGETVAGVARRHGVSQQSLCKWRKKASEGRLGNTEDILTKWQLLSPYLLRRQRSQWAAAEAAVFGLGGIKLLSELTGISQQSIGAAVRKLGATKGSLAGSLTRSGVPTRSGRPPNEVRDPQLEQALDGMLSDEAAGDPMSCQKWIRSQRTASGWLRWTVRRQANLRKGLIIAPRVVRQKLRTQADEAT